MARGPTPPLGQQWLHYIFEPRRFVRICVGLLGLAIIIDWFQHPEDFQRFTAYAIQIGVVFAGFYVMYRAIVPKKNKKGH